jgi:hypothetical protein
VKRQHSFLDISDKDPCRENPCLNNGACNRNGKNDFTCSCTDDYKGRRCEGSKMQKISKIEGAVIVDRANANRQNVITKHEKQIFPK